MTAASKGLGKATARQFAREGAKVAICARSEFIDKTAAEIARETGTEVLSLRADVTSQADIERVAIKFVSTAFYHAGQLCYTKTLIDAFTLCKLTKFVLLSWLMPLQP